MNIEVTPVSFDLWLPLIYNSVVLFCLPLAIISLRRAGVSWYACLWVLAGFSVDGIIVPLGLIAGSSVLMIRRMGCANSSSTP